MKKKIKVIHIIPTFGTGGAEKLVVDLLKFQNKNEYDIIAISLYEKKNSIYDEIIEKENLNVIYLDKKIGLDLSIIKKLNDIFNKIKPDVIHTHVYALKYTILPCILNSIKIKIHTVHNQADKEVDKKSQKIHKFAFKYLSYRPIGISNKIKSSIEQLYNLKDVELIRNGIDIEEFKFISGSKFESEKSNKVKLVHVGRFSEQKNHKMLIEAFKKASNEVSNIELYLIGDGENREIIEDLVKKYRLVDKVHFLGIRNDVRTILNNSDIFVFTSKWEGMPLSIMEAMSCGLPIISTNVGGISDIVESQVNGILVDSDNIDGFAEAIVKISKDKKMIKNYSDANKLKSATFDIRITQKSYERVYKNGINSRNNI